MKNVLFALMAIVAITFASCKKTETVETTTTVDSTAVDTTKVDTTATDTTAADTTKAVEVTKAVK